MEENKDNFTHVLVSKELAQHLLQHLAKGVFTDVYEMINGLQTSVTVNVKQNEEEPKLEQESNE